MEECGRRVVGDWEGRIEGESAASWRAGRTLLLDHIPSSFATLSSSEQRVLTLLSSLLRYKIYEPILVVGPEKLAGLDVPSPSKGWWTSVPALRYPSGHCQRELLREYTVHLIRLRALPILPPADDRPATLPRTKMPPLPSS